MKERRLRDQNLEFEWYTRAAPVLEKSRCSSSSAVRRELWPEARRSMHGCAAGQYRLGGTSWQLLIDLDHMALTTRRGERRENTKKRSLQYKSRTCIGKICLRYISIYVVPCIWRVCKAFWRLCYLYHEAPITRLPHEMYKDAIVAADSHDLVLDHGLARIFLSSATSSAQSVVSATCNKVIELAFLCLPYQLLVASLLLSHTRTHKISQPVGAFHVLTF
ncbi:hypothetical protein BJ546DRAFT_431670 [Cryomyces antarcticus]